MYQVISWNPVEARKPDIEQVKDFSQVLKLVYHGGTHGYQVIVQEFRGDDSYGDQLAELFDSSEPPIGSQATESGTMKGKRR